MKTTRFAPEGDLIIIGAKIWGPRGEKNVTLALDTAATETHLIPDIRGHLQESVRCLLFRPGFQTVKTSSQRALASAGSDRLRWATAPAKVAR